MGFPVPRSPVDRCPLMGLVRTFSRTFFFAYPEDVVLEIGRRQA